MIITVNKLRSFLTVVAPTAVILPQFTWIYHKFTWIYPIVHEFNLIYLNLPETTLINLNLPSFWNY